MSRWRRLVPLLVLMVVASARPLFAQSASGATPPTEGATPALAPTTEDPRTSEAREAFRLGAALAREARWDEARVMFARSNAFKAHPVTLYNIAFCDRAMGRPARALELFQRALDAHAAGPDHLADDLLAATRRYLAEASARVAHVRLRGVQAAVLRVDGQRLEPFRMQEQTWYVLADGPEPASEAPAEGATLLLDPGTHVLVASRKGLADVVETRAVAAGEELSVVFEFRPVPAEASAAARTPKARALRAATPEAFHFPERRWGYAALGVGTLGALVGGVAGGIALAARSQLHSECGPSGDNCPRQDAASISRLHASADIATVAFVIAGVGVASGVTLLLLAPPATSSRRRARLELRLAVAQLNLAGELW